MTIKRRILILNIDTSHFNRNTKKSKCFKQISLSDILIKNSTYANSWHLKNRLIKENILKNECSLCGLQPFWNGKPMIMILDHINGIHNDNRLENLRLVCPNCNSQLDTNCGKNVKDRKQRFCINCHIKLKYKGKTGLCIKCLREIKHQNKLKNDNLKHEKKVNVLIKDKIIKKEIKNIIKNNKKSILDSLFNDYTIEQIKQMIEQYGYITVGKKYNVTVNCVRRWCKKNKIEIDKNIILEKKRNILRNNSRLYLAQKQLDVQKQTTCKCGNKKRKTAKVCRECWLNQHRKIIQV